MKLNFLILLYKQTFEDLKMKTLQTLAAATILATSTAVSADWDMPFFGDNNNSTWNNNS